VKQIVTYRYKLKPTAAQRQTLGQWVGACRFVYNLCLDYRQTLWQQHHVNISKYDVQKELAILKQDYAWIEQVNAQTLQEVVERLWGAYDGFFKAGRGYPRFARKGQYRSLVFKQTVKLHSATCTVQLPKFGKVKYRNSRPLPPDAVIKKAAVSEQADGWYVSLSVETDVAPWPVAHNASVGVDVGVKALATLSTGESLPNPKHLKQAQHKLARLQRAVSRKKKGSSNRKKAVQKLAKQHLRVRNCRQDYLQKFTTRLLRENQAVVVEKLNIAGMVKNHKLAGAIADASWGELNRQLAYKALWYGRTYEQVAPQYTSQDCSVCGHRNTALTLAVRAWVCPACGAQHDRDVNAARNIEKKAVGYTVSACEIYAPVGVVAQESPIMGE
jgi:putative transposase